MSGNEAAWAIPAVGGAVLIASGATWAGGALATAITGSTVGGSTVGGGDGSRPPFHLLLIVQALRDGTPSLWPGVSPALVWSLAAALGLLVAGPVVTVTALWWVRRVRADDPRRSLARVRDVTHLTLPAAARSAARLRPSLAGRKTCEIDPADVGLALGRLQTGSTGSGKGRVLYSSWEDVVLAYMAPRSGKSTALAIPAVLSAPGAEVATSNKADVWAATAAIRAAETGQRVWTFDPQRISWAPRTWWWDPLADLSSVERPSGWPGTSC